MNRKFRALCVIDGKTLMQEFVIMGFDNGIAFWPLPDELHHIDEYLSPYMMSLNVKGYKGEYKDRHKNEVELLEGDIVEAASEGRKGTFIIKYRNEAAPMWLLWPNYQSNHHWNIAASDIGREKGDYYDDLKRIGNIYQNPELVKSVYETQSNFIKNGNDSLSN